MADKTHFYHIAEINSADGRVIWDHFMFGADAGSTFTAYVHDACALSSEYEAMLSNMTWRPPCHFDETYQTWTQKLIGTPYTYRINRLGTLDGEPCYKDWCAYTGGERKTRFHYMMDIYQEGYDVYESCYQHFWDQDEFVEWADECDLCERNPQPFTSNLKETQNA